MRKLGLFFIVILLTTGIAKTGYCAEGGSDWSAKVVAGKYNDYYIAPGTGRVYALKTASDGTQYFQELLTLGYPANAEGEKSRLAETNRILNRTASQTNP